jgi:hypothetical protein
MAIDSGLGLTFNENYPVAGINQSSQGFRDNFTVIKRATENLQSASATDTSLVTLTTSVGTGGVYPLSGRLPEQFLQTPLGQPECRLAAPRLHSSHDRRVAGLRWLGLEGLHGHRRLLGSALGRHHPDVQSVDQEGHRPSGAVQHHPDRQCHRNCDSHRPRQRLTEHDRLLGDCQFGEPRHRHGRQLCRQRHARRERHRRHRHGRERQCSH